MDKGNISGISAVKNVELLTCIKGGEKAINQKRILLIVPSFTTTWKNVSNFMVR
jgi:hypothetical protein